MRLFVAIALIAVVLCPVASAHADYPKAVGYVNDFVSVLSQEEAQTLDSELRAFEQRTTVEFVVVTVSSLQGENEVDYARGLGNAWGVGKRDRNNGIVFLIAPNDRKARIEAGPGLNALLTNERARSIMNHAVLQRFRAGNMSGGIIAGAHEIMQAIEERPASSTPDTSVSEGSDLTTLAIILGFLVGIALLAVIIGIPVRRMIVRRQIPTNVADIGIWLARIEESGAHADVTSETRERIAGIRKDLDAIAQTIRTGVDQNGNAHVDWLAMREALSHMQSRITQADYLVQKDIDYAKRAREEGPALLEKIPQLIKEAEERLAKGKASPRAAAHLAEARTQYAQAVTTRSGMSVVDWIILYAILRSAESSVSHSLSTHASTNNLTVSSSSSDASSSSGSPVSFGGGTFGSTDTGASGSW